MTGVILRFGTKAELVNGIGANWTGNVAIVPNEIVFATDTSEHGWLVNNEVVWKKLNSGKLSGSIPPLTSVGAENDSYIQYQDDNGVVTYKEWFKYNGVWVPKPNKPIIMDHIPTEAETASHLVGTVYYVI